jgi:phage/plasmid-like protein (TIGR03299 family)
MAHELEIRDGQASMFYVNEEPWHGLGTKLDRPATAVEAIKAARLDWRVMKVPLYAVEGDTSISVPDTFGVVRDDLWGKKGCPVLGIVGKDYTPLQNSEAFSFFDPIVGQNAAIYHTAGVLRDGERIWLLAKLPSQIVVVGDDVADKYLLLSNSHDGRSAVQVKFTPIRVVCQNTLTQALSDGTTIRIAHTPNMQERLKQAHRLLGIVDKGFTNLAAAFQAMCKLSLDASKLDEYLAEVFPDPKDPEEPEHWKAVKRIQESRFWSRYFFEHGKGNDRPGARGTLWAAYNGVTELIDHRRTQQTPDRRLDSAWFGDGYHVKGRALRIARAKLHAWLN